MNEKQHKIRLLFFQVKGNFFFTIKIYSQKILFTRREKKYKNNIHFPIVRDQPSNQTKRCHCKDNFVNDRDGNRVSEWERETKKRPEETLNKS